MTIKESVYDILERVGQNSDDSDLYRWIQRQIDTVMADQVHRYLESRGWDIPPSMLVPYECIVTHKEQAECEGCAKTVIKLPVDPIDLPGDVGIYSVNRPGGKSIDRLGGIGQATLLKTSSFFTGGWYRVQNKIYLEGSYPTNFKATVYLIPDSTENLDEDKEYPAPSDLLKNVLLEVEAATRRKLEMPTDITSDGKQESK